MAKMYKLLLSGATRTAAIIVSKAALSTTVSLVSKSFDGIIGSYQNTNTTLPYDSTEVLARVTDFTQNNPGLLVVLHGTNLGQDVHYASLAGQWLTLKGEHVSTLNLAFNQCSRDYTKGLDGQLVPRAQFNLLLADIGWVETTEGIMALTEQRRQRQMAEQISSLHTNQHHRGSHHFNPAHNNLQPMGNPQSTQINQHSEVLRQQRAMQRGGWPYF